MSRMPRRLKRLLIAAAAIIAVFAVLHLPATTKQGVNFDVSTYRLPLYVKAVDFLHRHYKYEALAHEITQGCATDRQRVMAVFEWTRRNIRATPRDWPAIDDHILHIIIRGHGMDDQMADVFTTLATYAGVPAYWTVIRRPEPGAALIPSFARIDGRWVLFDVANGLVFTNRAGGLLSVEELAADPTLVRLTAGRRTWRGEPYEAYFTGFLPPPVPRPLHAQLQMPAARMTHELRRLLRLSDARHERLRYA